MYVNLKFYLKLKYWSKKYLTFRCWIIMSLDRQKKDIQFKSQDSLKTKNNIMTITEYFLFFN